MHFLYVNLYYFLICSVWSNLLSACMLYHYYNDKIVSCNFRDTVQIFPRISRILDASFIILDMLFVLSSRWLCNVSRVTINRRRKLCAIRLDPHAYSNLDCRIPCVHRPSPKSNVFRLHRFIACFLSPLYAIFIV